VHRGRGYARALVEPLHPAAASRLLSESLTMHIAIWTLTLLLLGLWSLTAWALAGVLSLGAGATAGVSAWVAQQPFGDWVELWMPGALQWLDMALALTQSLLAWLGGAAPWLVWGLWGVGAALLVVGAVLLSLLAAGLRRTLAPRPAA
jgi:hypothetical protein